MSSHNSSDESSSVPLFSGDEHTLSQLPAVVAAWDRERPIFSWESEYQQKNEPNENPEVNSYPSHTQHQPLSPQAIHLQTYPHHDSDTSTEPPSQEFNWSSDGGVDKSVNQFAHSKEDSMDSNAGLAIPKQVGFHTGTSSTNAVDELANNARIYKCSGDKFGCRYYACSFCFPNLK